MNEGSALLSEISRVEDLIRSSGSGETIANLDVLKHSSAQLAEQFNACKVALNLLTSTDLDDNAPFHDPKLEIAELKSTQENCELELKTCEKTLTEIRTALTRLKESAASRDAQERAFWQSGEEEVTEQTISTLSAHLAESDEAIRTLSGRLETSKLAGEFDELNKEALKNLAEKEKAQETLSFWSSHVARAKETKTGVMIETLQIMSTLATSIVAGMFPGHHAIISIAPSESGGSNTRKPLITLSIDGKTRPISALSGGERDRTCMAILAALNMQSRSMAIILDEAMASLDDDPPDVGMDVCLGTREMVMQTLMRHCGGQRAIIHVVHGMETQEDYPIVYMKNCQACYQEIVPYAISY